MPDVTPIQPAGEPPSVSYHMSVDDAVAFAVHHHRASGQLRNARLALLVIGLACAGLVLLLLGTQGWLLAALFFAFFSLIAAFQSGRTIRQAIHKQYAKGKNLIYFGRHTVTLHEHYVRNDAPMCQACYRWEMIEKLDESETYLMIYYAPLMALVIPKAAFASDAEADGFLAYASERFEWSRQTEPDLSSPPWAQAG